MCRILTKVIERSEELSKCSHLSPDGSTVELLKPLGSVAKASKKDLIFPKMLTSRRAPYHCSRRSVWFHECSPRRERQLQRRMDIFLMVTPTPWHSMNLLWALTNFLFLPGPSILQTLPGPYIPRPLRPPSLLLPMSVVFWKQCPVEIRS